MVGPYTPIPEVGEDLASLRSVVVALKNTIQILIGSDGTSGAANQIFINRSTPVASKKGDGWVRPAALPGETVQWSVWDGTRWLKIV